METKVWTVLDLIQWTTAFLKQKGIDNSRREAEDLLGHVLELDRLKLYLAFETQPSPSELTAFRALVARRAKREPLQYLLGWQPFLGLKIRCDRRALIPRPETERLAQLAIDFLRPLGAAARFADMGTGSGCIALAILAQTEARGVATDISQDALALADENASTLGMQDRLQFLNGSWLEPMKGEFDLLVSNPPYIAEGDREGLQAEVRDYEPADALFSGKDGMTALKALLQSAAGNLRCGGWLMLECGKGQPDILKMGMPKEWTEVRVEKDQFEVERFLLMRRA